MFEAIKKFFRKLSDKFVFATLTKLIKRSNNHSIYYFGGPERLLIIRTVYKIADVETDSYVTGILNKLSHPCIKVAYSEVINDELVAIVKIDISQLYSVSLRMINDLISIAPERIIDCNFVKDVPYEDTFHNGGLNGMRQVSGRMCVYTVDYN